MPRALWVAFDTAWPGAVLADVSELGPLRGARPSRGGRAGRAAGAGARRCLSAPAEHDGVARQVGRDLLGDHAALAGAGPRARGGVQQGRRAARAWQQGETGSGAAGGGRCGNEGGRAVVEGRGRGAGEMSWSRLAVGVSGPSGCAGGLTGTQGLRRGLRGARASGGVGRVVRRDRRARNRARWAVRARGRGPSSGRGG